MSIMASGIHLVPANHHVEIDSKENSSCTTLLQRLLMVVSFIFSFCLAGLIICGTDQCAQSEKCKCSVTTKTAAITSAAVTGVLIGVLLVGCCLKRSKVNFNS